VSFSTPTATDNCPGVTVSCSPASGSAFARGTTTVTCTATDASANTNACTFRVTVNDAELPVITCPANIVVSTAGGSCASNVVFAPIATDNCGAPIVTCTPVSGSSFGLGTTPVSCMADDGHGNTA